MYLVSSLYSLLSLALLKETPDYMFLLLVS